MATLPTQSETPPPVELSGKAYYEEPPIKPPPGLNIGALAWMRENLFKSVGDALITVIASAIALGTIVGLLGWAIGSANWFVIISNLRVFLVGTVPVTDLWRYEWALLGAAFVIGLTIYGYMRRVRGFGGIALAISILLLGVPSLIEATVPPASAYLAAGEGQIVSGTVQEIPQATVGFTGQAGDTITLGVPALADDASLRALSGFTDRAAAALLNAAINRARTDAERETLEARLAANLLTVAQRETVSARISALAPTDEVAAQYDLDGTAVDVVLRRGTTLEVIANATLIPGAEPLRLTLPEDGWYILDKTTGSSAVALVQAQGIYPFRERNLTRAGARLTEYVRMTDSFTTEEPRPQIDGTNTPILFITDNQYQGVRSIGDYLFAFVAPFFRDISMATLYLTLAGILGYGAGIGLAVVSPARKKERHVRERVHGTITWAWVLYLMALLMLSFGIGNLDAIGVGILLSRFAWVGALYFAGMQIKQPYGRPLIGLLLTLGIAGTLIAESLTVDAILSAFGLLFTNGVPALLGALPWGAIIGIGVWLLVGVSAARGGVNANTTLTQSGARRALIVSILIAAALLILPPLLLGAGSDAGATGNLLPRSDTRRWGGFMLTMLLTIVAVIASFPLGVLLALGRRSSLPVVKYTSIVYIELVRGVPLITVLFMAQLLVPLLNPSFAEVDNVIRAMIGLTLFSGAYLAENVRGGLQSIPPGQEEAAKALGLNGVQVTLLVTLPQALRAVIPALVGQAIALFKDTSLVALVGLIDLVGVSRSVISQAEFIGLQSEVFLFVSILYFVISYLMAYISRRVEASGSGAARRV